MSVQALAPPIELFDFDFATTPLDVMTKGRERGIPLTFTDTGILTAFLIFWELRCDEDPSNNFNSGPSNSKLVAWDQSLRTLPVELRVTTGQSIEVLASHDYEAVRIGLPQIRPEMLRRDMVGHTELFGKPPERQ